MSLQHLKMEMGVSIASWLVTLAVSVIESFLTSALGLHMHTHMPTHANMPTYTHAYHTHMKMENKKKKYNVELLASNVAVISVQKHTIKSHIIKLFLYFLVYVVPRIEPLALYIIR